MNITNTLLRIIILFVNWEKYSSTFWVEYYYTFYNDIIRETYESLTIIP